MALKTKYKWLHWFQKTADDIDDVEWSPKMKVTIQKINDMMPVVLREALLTYIKDQYSKSEATAIGALNDVKAKLNEII